MVLNLKLIFPLLLCLAFLAQASCSERGIPEQVPDPVAGPEVAFPLNLGTVSLEAQLAVTSAEMRTGLMFRKSLPSEIGMLFVYRETGSRSFWMRNTAIPLDLGFFSKDGVLREIYPLYPHDETSVPSRADTIQFALEVNQGWFAAHKVKPGARLDLEKVKVALRERGFDAAEFGLD